MNQRLDIMCPRCGRFLVPGAERCECGAPAPRDPFAPPAAHVGRVGRPAVVGDLEATELLGVRVPSGVSYLLLGVPLAIAIHCLSCGLMKLGTGVLFHELGHAAVAWALGHPALPVAAGVTYWVEQQTPLLALLVWAALGYGAYHAHFVLRQPALAIPLAALALLHPLLAFHSPLKWTSIHVAGHAFELGFAVFFWWRAWRGGYSPTPHLEQAERPLYATLGWFLWFDNMYWWWGILLSPAVRYHYETVARVEEGNDFVRVAQLWHLDLGWLALGNALATVAALAAFAVLVGRDWRARAV